MLARSDGDAGRGTLWREVSKHYVCREGRLTDAG